MGIIRKIRSNFNSARDVRLFINIFLLATVLPLLIKFLSLPRLMIVLTPIDSKAYENQNLEKAKDKTVKFTDYILGYKFWIYKPTCLKRSLILYHFLRKLGINVHICFGVKFPRKMVKNKLEGHAWLVYKGDIFLEKSIEMTTSYKVTYCFPEMGRQDVQTVLEQS